MKTILISFLISFLCILMLSLSFPVHAFDNWLLLVHDWKKCFHPNDPDPLYVYDNVDVWFYSSNDVIAAQFSIVFPSNVVYADVTYNSALSVIEGDIESGLRVAFSECQADIGWIASIQVMVLDITQSMINLVAHPDNEFVIIATCAETNPIVSYRGAYFTINYCIESAVENSSWGAIKQVFKQ